MRTSPHNLRRPTSAVSDQAEKGILDANCGEEVLTASTMDAPYMSGLYLSAAVDAPSNRSNGLQ